MEQRYGRGFGEKNLRRMVQFAEAFPDERIVAALWRQLGWFAFQAARPDQGSAARREFYAELCRSHAWSTRTLADKIGAML